MKVFGEPGVGKTDATPDAVSQLIKAAQNVPDPEEEGFCPSCGGGQLKLEGFRVVTGNHSYVAHRWKHRERCWYWKLQAAIKAATELTGRET